MEVKVKINYLSGQLHQKFFSQYNKKKIQQYYLTWLLLIFLPLFFFSPEWDVKKQILFVIVPVAAHNIIMHCLCRGSRKYSDHNTNTLIAILQHTMKDEGWRTKKQQLTAQERLRTIQDQSHQARCWQVAKWHQSTLLHWQRLAISSTWLPYLLVYKSTSCISRLPIFKAKNQISHYFGENKWNSHQ